MSTTSRIAHVSVRAIPTFLLIYALTRWIDGSDGEHGPGLAWDVGHWFFLAAFMLFGYVVAFAGWVVSGRGKKRLATATTIVGLIGVALFVWVILGDLYPAVEEAYDRPDLIMNVGPLAFLLGLVLPLAVLSWSSPRALPWFSPIAAVAAFALLAASLDSLAVSSVLFGLAIWRLPTADRPGAVSRGETARQG